MRSHERVVPKAIAPTIHPLHPDCAIAPTFLSIGNDSLSVSNDSFNIHNNSLSCRNNGLKLTYNYLSVGHDSFCVYSYSGTCCANKLMRLGKTGAIVLTVHSLHSGVSSNPSDIWFSS
jgi:hypothetical protein